MPPAFSCYALSWRNIATLAHATQDVVRSSLTIIVRRNAGAGPILGQMEEIANDLIQNHSSLKHSSEVANAVWACLALRLQISHKAVDAVSPQLENENEASVTRSWRRTS